MILTKRFTTAMLLLALLLAPAARTLPQSELPNVQPFAWSFKNFSTNFCSPPESYYTWDRYRETYIGIPPEKSAASGFDTLFFEKIFEKELGAAGHCYGMSLMALQIAKKGGHLGFCGPPGHYSGDNVGAPALNNDECAVDENQFLGPANAELRRAIEETHAHQVNLTSVRHVLEILAENETDGLSAYAQVEQNAPAILSMARSQAHPLKEAHALVAYAAREVSGQKRIYVYDPNRSIAIRNESTHPLGYLLDEVEWYIKGDNYVEVHDDGSWTFRFAGWEMELDDDGDPVLDDDGFEVVEEITWPEDAGLLYVVPLSVAGPRDRNPLSTGMSVGSLLSTILLSGSGASLNQVSGPGGKTAFVPGTKKLEPSPAKRLLEVFPILAGGQSGGWKSGLEPYAYLPASDGPRDFDVKAGHDGYDFQLAHAGGSLRVRTGSGSGADLLRIADHASDEPRIVLFNRSGASSHDVELTQAIDGGRETRTFRLTGIKIPRGGMIDLKRTGDGRGLGITSPVDEVRFDLELESSAGGQPRKASIGGLSVAAGSTALLRPQDWSDLKPGAIEGGARPLELPELEGYQSLLFARKTGEAIGPDFIAALDLNGAAGGRTTHDARSGLYTQVSSGRGLEPEGDSLQIAYARLRGDFEMTVEITARADPVLPGNLGALRGLLAREDLSPAARSSFLALGASAGKSPEARWIERYAADDTEALVDLGPLAIGQELPHLKLVRRGESFHGFASADGRAWIPVGSSTWHGLEASAEVIVGFASATGTSRAPLSSTFRVAGFGAIEPQLPALLPGDASATGSGRIVLEHRFTGPDGSLPGDFTTSALPGGAPPDLRTGRLRLTRAGAAETAAAAFSRAPIANLEDGIHQIDFDVFFTASRGEKPAGGLTLTLLEVEGGLDDFVPQPGDAGGGLGFEGLASMQGSSWRKVRGAAAVELDLAADGPAVEGSISGEEGAPLHAGIDSACRAASVKAASIEGLDPFRPDGLHATVIYNRGEVSVFVSARGEARPLKPALRARMLPLDFRSERASCFVGFTASTGEGSQTTEVDNLEVRLLDCGDAPEEAVILGEPVGIVPRGATVVLDGSASRAGPGDERRDRVSHHWEVIAGGARIVGPDWGPTVSVRMTEEGPVALRLTVDDGICENPSSADVAILVEGSISVFHRGDADDNGLVQITDAVRILNYLFLGQVSPPCLDAADVDDNGQVQLTDAVRVLGYLFLGTGTIASPGPPPAACGPDPEGSPGLGCESYASCK